MSEASAVQTSPATLILGGLLCIWLVGGLIALPFVPRLVRRLVPEPGESSVAWGLVEVLFVAFALVLALFGVALVLPREADMPMRLVYSTASFLVPAMLVLAIAISRDPRRLGALGLRGRYAWRSAAAGGLSYLAWFPVLGIVGYAWFTVLRSLGVDDLEQELIRGLQDLPPDRRAVPIVLGVLVMPFIEELLFRGFLQPVLVRHLKPVFGIALASALFAILHGRVPAVPIFALSCVLGYVMYRTQRLHAAWSVHALHNGLVFYLMYAHPEFQGWRP